MQAKWKGDQNRRCMAMKEEGDRKMLQGLVQNQWLKSTLQIVAEKKLHQLSKNNGPNRIRNRCSVTGRGRGLLRCVRVSRIVTREEGRHGQLFGIQKV